MHTEKHIHNFNRKFLMEVFTLEYNMGLDLRCTDVNFLKWHHVTPDRVQKGSFMNRAVNILFLKRRNIDYQFLQNSDSFRKHNFES